MDYIYFDIGVNLFCRQFKNPEKIIEDAAAAGICCILTGSEPAENRKIDAFVRTHDAYGTAGIHPHNADRASEADFEEIRAILLNNTRVVAVGECGLDYDRMFSSKEGQLSCLKRHMRLARELHKPLFLHERAAFNDLCACFKDSPDLCQYSVIHCFTGSREMLKTYLDMGFSIGITGWICDERRSGPLKEAVSILPPDRVLIETDAPYLTPRGVPGLSRINTPVNIRYVARTLAACMNIDESTLIRSAAANTRALFGIG